MKPVNKIREKCKLYVTDPHLKCQLRNDSDMYYQLEIPDENSSIVGISENELDKVEKRADEICGSCNEFVVK